MGKHGKSKSNGSSGQSRPAPYGKKPKVEVTFEGSAPASAPTRHNAKTEAASSAPTASSSKAIDAAEVQKSSAAAAKGKGKARAESSVPTPSPTFIIIAGSYEKLLYGLEGSYPVAGGKATLEPIFIFPAHLACVKAVAASPGGKWLATGSEDEFVKVWDLRRRKEVGSLSQHTGSITSVHFPTASHLITTSADSTLSLFRTSDWALLKSLKGHSGRVNHVDVHPTGRVALSVGKDATLKMWDLMRGRGAASLPLGSEPELVKFSPLGTHFAVLFPRKIQIYSLTLKLLHTLETKSRFNSLLFTLLPASDEDEEDSELLCVGTEKGVVEVYRIDVGTNDGDEQEDEGDDEAESSEAKEDGKGSGAELERVATLIGHTNRIRAISALNFPVSTSEGELSTTVLLTTVSSDGLINVYDLAEVDPVEGHDEDQIEPCASYNTKGSRLTCVFLADGQDPARKAGVQTQNSANTVDAEGESDEGDNEGDNDIYASNEDDEDEEDEEDDMAVEFEDEEEEEEEEGEYED